MMTTGADDGWWHLVTTVMKAAGPPVSLRMIILQINSTVSLDTWIIAFWLQLHVESAVYSPWNSLNSVSIRSDTPLFLPPPLHSLSLSLFTNLSKMDGIFLHTSSHASSCRFFGSLLDAHPSPGRVPPEPRRFEPMESGVDRNLKLFKASRSLVSSSAELHLDSLWILLPSTMCLNCCHSWHFFLSLDGKWSHRIL